MHSRTWNAAITIVLVSFGLSGTSHGAAECKFTYDERFKREIVSPTLAKYEGKLASNYDINEPGIVEKKGIARLIFLQKYSSAMDPPNFIIVYDPCRNTVVKAGETIPTNVAGSEN